MDPATPMPGTPQPPDQTVTSPDMLPPVPQGREPHSIALQRLKAKIADLVQQHHASAAVRQSNPAPVPPAAQDQPGGDAQMRHGGLPGVSTAGVPGVSFTNDYTARPDSSQFESVPVNRLAPPDMQVRGGMESQGGHTDYTPSGNGFAYGDRDTGSRFYRPAGFNAYQPGVTPRPSDGSSGPRSAPERGVVNALLEGEDIAADHASAAKQGMSPYAHPRSPYVPEVGAGEYGLPYAPPIPTRGPAEMRSANEPATDWLAQRTNPLVGRAAQSFLDVGKQIGDEPGIQGFLVHGAEEATGAPSIARGGLNIGRGIEEGSPLRVAGGAAEVGLGALPAAGALRVARPGLVATGGLLGASQALPDIAEAAEMKTPRQQLVDQLKTELNDLQAKRDAVVAKNPPPKFSSDPDRGRTQREAYESKLKNLTSPYDEQIKSKTFEITDANTGALAEAEKNLPFRQQYPVATRALQAVGEVAPALAAWRLGVTERRNVADAIMDYETAVRAGDAGAASRAQDLLRSYTAQTWGEWARHKAGVVGGGIAGTTVANIAPELSDLSSEKQHEAALNKLLLQDPDYLKERGIQITAGGVFGPAIGEEVGRFLPGLANYQRARALSRAAPLPVRTPPPIPPPPPPPPPAGPRVLNAQAWPPEASQAAKEYLASRAGEDVNTVTTADIVAAMTRRGMIPNETNVANRLEATKDYLNRTAGNSTIRGSDVMAAPRTYRGRRLLSVPAATAAAGTAERLGDQYPEDTDTYDSPRNMSTVPEPQFPQSRPAYGRTSVPSGHSQTPWGLRGPDGRFATYPR